MRQDTKTEAVVEVHLEDRLQRRNIAIYVARFSLVYLAAPILYVGFVQGGLCKRLGASDLVANLPSAAFLFLTGFFPIIMAWAFPQVRYVRRVMMLGYLIAAVAGGVAAAALLLPTPDWLRIAVVLVHGAVVACSTGTAWTFEWEVLGRGISESRRGPLFAMTFSIGPLFAVIGSLGSQLLISNEVFGWTPSHWPQIPYPLNYAVLYGATLPLMLLSAVLVNCYAVPLPAVEVQRKAFLEGVFGGFGRFLSNRLIAVACAAFLLVGSGIMIQNNMVFFTREVVGLAEDAFVGYQNALRFGCKVLAGLALGWILKRTNPRMNLFVTAMLGIAAVLWILSARRLFGPSLLFMVAFGLNGAGELMGHYYPYYVFCLSPKSQTRRNIAFVTLVNMPIAFSPALFGLISDRWSLTASFWAALAMMVAALVLVAGVLPARPRPRAEDLEAADLERELL
jgi:hypothetical protein